MLNLDPGNIYVVRRDRGGPPARNATRDPQALPPVALSPGGDLVAYSAWREVSCDPAYSLRARFAVVVDTTGDEIAVLPGAWSFAWSPSGDRLAVVYGPADRKAGHAPDSIGVIDIRTREGTTFQLEAAHLGWRDAETLVLHSSRTRLFSLRTRELRTTRHRGWIPSPDVRYSLGVDLGSGTPIVVSEASGVDVSARVQALLGGKGAATTIPPFWVEGDPSGHLLCVPTVRPPAAPTGDSESAAGPSRPGVHLVDVAKGKIIRSIDGIGLASSSDRRAVLICRDGGLVLEDL